MKIKTKIKLLSLIVSCHLSLLSCLENFVENDDLFWDIIPTNKYSKSFILASWLQCVLGLSSMKFGMLNNSFH